MNRASNFYNNQFVFYVYLPDVFDVYKYFMYIRLIGQHVW